MFDFIANLRLGRKLALLGGTAAVVCGMLMTAQVRTALGELRWIDSELAGLEPTSTLLEVVRLTQQHRGLSAAVLGGKAESESERATRQADADKAVQRFDAIVQNDVDNQRIRDDWQRVSGEWRALASAVSARQIAAADAVARHGALVATQIELIDRVSDHFGLTLDPAADGYFLVIASLQHMPRLTELLGQARARGTLMLVTQSATPQAKGSMAGLSARTAGLLREMQLSMDKAYDANPAAKLAVSDVSERTAAQAQGVLDLVNKEIVNAEVLNYPSAEYLRATTAAIDAVYELSGAARQALQATLEARRSALHTQQAILFSAIAMMVAIGLWLGFKIARSITGSAVAARNAARRIADGDLTGEMPAGGRDELGELLNAMRQMQTNLAMVVADVRANSESVATASAQIAQGNQDLSQRTEQQASSLQETAATMEELGTTVRQNADNAQQANQLAQAASGVAIKGGEVVGQVVETMKGISDSSRRIADIIGTIDGIAFQTNILALNAAVEAARAGEQGRGFAVVASEVRSLAQRSAEAAKEIKNLIGASVERVEQGTALVDQAGQTMDEVVNSIRRVTDIVGEISSASSEQSSGVSQVGQAVTQMDQATQQNAALVEQSAAAAESLKVQAGALLQAVSVFKLASGQHASAAPKAAAPQASSQV
jgi:methyl-accepting chemotaxis protein